MRAKRNDLSTRVLRLVEGGLMTGHGAQKLFGAFEGPGPQGTAQMMDGLGLQPSRGWGQAAGLSEFAGGALTTLGLCHPLGPLGIMSSMGMAAGTVHRGKPIWVTSGGAELPVLTMAVAAAVVLSGPGRYSLNEALALRLPNWLAAGAAVTAGALLAYGVVAHSRVRGMPQAQENGGEEGEKRAVA